MAVVSDSAVPVAGMVELVRLVVLVLLLMVRVNHLLVSHLVHVKVMMLVLLLVMNRVLLVHHRVIWRLVIKWKTIWSGCWLPVGAVCRIHQRR